MCKKILFLLIFIFSSTCYSQNPGEVAQLYGTCQGLKQSDVLTTAIQTDGKIVLGGKFTTYNGKSQNYIIRFNIDGTQDTTFDIGVGFNNYVNTILIQYDGKILVGGNFTNYKGNNVGYAIRLNVDGSLDTNFGTIFNGEVFTFARNGGQTLVGGKFKNQSRGYSGAEKNINYLARIGYNGYLDTNFKPFSGYSTSDLIVKSIAFSGGKIYVGGKYESETYGYLSRLNNDGTDDITFYVDRRLLNGAVLALITTSTGKLIIGGEFSNGILTYNIQDQKVDTSIIVVNGDVKTLTLQKDSKIIIGGSFTTIRKYYDYNKNRIFRLLSNGEIDTGFDIGTGFNEGSVNSVSLQTNGKIIVGGSFSSYNQMQTQKGITSLNADGSTDLIFNIPLGFSDLISTIAAQPDGKTIIGGKFTSYKRIIQNRICRLNPDGTIDSTFNSGTGFNDNVNLIVLQPDGKILVCNNSTSYNGTRIDSYNSIIRLNSNGSIDTSFKVSGSFTPIQAIALQTDGKIIIAGDFSSDKDNKRYLFRLLPNGSLDSTFKLVDEFNYPVIRRPARTIVVLSNGQIMVGVDGEPFSTYYNNITLLNSDGSIAKRSFGKTSTYNVFDIALQKDGKTLVRCELLIDSTIKRCLLRCNSDGSIDTSFGTWKDVSDFLLLPDGKIIIAYGYGSQYRLGRVDKDGWLDGTFNSSIINGIPFLANDSVSSISLQSDGSLLVGGAFISYDNKSSDYLVKLFLDKTLGNESFDLKKSLVYPNPVKDILQLDSLENSYDKYEIFDIQGKKVNYGEVTEKEINVSNLSKGVYILKLTSERNTINQKFIKE